MADALLHKRALPGRFEVERVLGRGGMATVYLAKDTELDRPVALKVLAEPLAGDAAFRARFLREARLAARLVHAHVVRVYDIGEDERGLSIVMEYVDGGTLADELARRGRLPLEEAVGVAIQVCSALQAAHAEQLVHRDVKPQNILRRSDGLVKLADFGVARSLAATRHTEIGTVLGTMAYLSPEQARGEQVTAAADLYSLGVVLYELLTGEIPFPATSLAELITKRELGEFAPPRELAPMPRAVNDAIVACLASRPADRPSSAAALARQLAGAVDEPLTVPLRDEATPAATEILAPPDHSGLERREYANRRARALARARKRPSIVLAVLAVLAVAAAAVVAAVTLSGSGPKQRAAAPPTGPRQTVSSPGRSKTGATSTTATTHAAVSRQLDSTPSQTIVEARAAIFRAESAGLLDPGAGGDLDRRLDAVAASLAAGDTQNASREAGDLSQQLDNLARGGQLNGTAAPRIEQPIDRLAALLPSTAPAPAPRVPPGHARGHGHHGGKEHKGPHDD